MDNIVFYQPPLASVSQPPRFSGTATASPLPLEPISSLPTHQIATHMNTILQGAHDSYQNSRNDTQGKFTVSQNFPNCSADDNDDFFPDIEELLSGTMQKTMPASVDLNGDDQDGFIDIETVLSDMQQKGPTRDSDYNGMADLVDIGTRDGSPAGSSEDPVVLGDDESAVEGAETGCSDSDVESKAKSHSDRRATGHQDGGNSPNGVIEQTTLRLSPDRPITLSLDPEPETHSVSLDLVRETEDELGDASAEGNPKGQNDTSTKIANLLASFDKHQASDNTVPELQHSHVENTRAPQLILPVTSSHDSDYKNGRLRKRLRRGSPRCDCRKRPHTAAPIIPIITDHKDKDLESRIQIPDEEEELSLVDGEQDDDTCADGSDDEEYSNMSKAAGSSQGGPPRPRKRVKRAKDIEFSDIETPSTLDVSPQATIVTSSSGMQESEEIPIYGFLTLKAMGSKVVYCLTFSQQLLPEPSILSFNPEVLSVNSHEPPPKAAVSINDSKEWVIEKIMGERQKKLPGRGSRTLLEYRVKWQGFLKPTWEPATALEDSAALDAYLDSGKEN